MAIEIVDLPIENDELQWIYPYLSIDNGRL